MASDIIGASSSALIPPTDGNTRLLRLVADVDDQLESAIAFSDLAQWIESARYFIDTVRFYIEHREELQQFFKQADFRWCSPAWDMAENKGLEYLQIELTSRLLGLRETAKATTQPGHGEQAAATAEVPPDFKKKMGDALNEGAYAHHAIQATLDAMSDEIYGRCTQHVQGLFEAAAASVERLDHAMATGLDVWGAQ